jgi:uncharacterized protein (DUF433 family)
MSLIRVDPGVMGGQPVLRGTRFLISYILKHVANGMSLAQISDEFNLNHNDLIMVLREIAEIYFGTNEDNNLGIK